MFKYLTFAIFVFTCFTNSFAKNFQKDESFKKVEGFLSSIKTLTGEVSQVTTQGDITSNFYLQVPSKLRINYTSKNLPIQMIVTPNIVTYYDTKLDQKSQVKTPSSILEIVVDGKLSFVNKNIIIKNVITKDNKIIIDFIYYKTPNSKIRAVFDVNTLHLKNIVIKSEGETTIINFKNLVFNKPIKSKVFKIENKKVDAKFDF